MNAEARIAERMTKSAQELCAEQTPSRKRIERSNLSSDEGQTHQSIPIDCRVGGRSCPPQEPSVCDFVCPVRTPSFHPKRGAREGLSARIGRFLYIFNEHHGDSLGLRPLAHAERP